LGGLSRRRKSEKKSYGDFGGNSQNRRGGRLMIAGAEYKRGGVALGDLFDTRELLE